VIPFGSQMGYYAAAAQVIPVLMLVLLVGESRFFKAKPADGLWLLLALFAMFVLLLGELTALRTLGRGSDSAALWACTTGGLVYGLVFVFQSAVRTLLLEDLKEVSPKRRRGLMRLSLVAAFGSIAIIAVILLPSY
jgi:hypothetical protein